MAKTGLIFLVYKRPVHTQKALEGLRQNNIDHLYIFADGPKNSEEKEAVCEVREIISSIDWCKKDVIQSETNRGITDFRKFAIDYVLKRHERMILVEDDCVPSSDFVNFMEQCFDKYDNEPRVMNVVGYAMPINISSAYPYDIYFTYNMGGWGQGVWRRTWSSYKPDFEDFYRIQKSPELRRKIDRGGRDLFYIMKQQVEGKLDSMLIWWTWHILKNDGVCINPVRSRIQNIGHDGSGRHCDRTDKFRVELSDQEQMRNLRFPGRIEVDKNINRKFIRVTAGGLYDRGKEEIKKLFMLMRRGR